MNTSKTIAVQTQHVHPYVLMHLMRYLGNQHVTTVEHDDGWMEASLTNGQQFVVHAMLEHGQNAYMRQRTA